MLRVRRVEWFELNPERSLRVNAPMYAPLRGRISPRLGNQLAGIALLAIFSMLCTKQ